MSITFLQIPASRISLELKLQFETNFTWKVSPHSYWRLITIHRQMWQKSDKFCHLRQVNNKAALCNSESPSTLCHMTPCGFATQHNATSLHSTMRLRYTAQCGFATRHNAASLRSTIPLRHVAIFWLPISCQSHFSCRVAYRVGKSKINNIPYRL